MKRWRRRRRWRWRRRRRWWRLRRRREEDRTQTAARRELVERALLSSSPPSGLAGYGFVTRVFPALRHSPFPSLSVQRVRSTTFLIRVFSKVEDSSAVFREETAPSADDEKQRYTLEKYPQRTFSARAKILRFVWLETRETSETNETYLKRKRRRRKKKMRIRETTKTGKISESRYAKRRRRQRRLRRQHLDTRSIRISRELRDYSGRKFIFIRLYRACSRSRASVAGFEVFPSVPAKLSNLAMLEKRNENFVGLVKKRRDAISVGKDNVSSLEALRVFGIFVS